jgi:DNA-binding MarR family transcriptional regulator
MSGEGDRDLARQADEIEAILRAIRRLLWRPFEADIEQGGLTAPQVAALTELAAADGVSLTDLSRRLALSHSTVSGIVDRLERRGLVHRRPDPADGRSTSIVLADPVKQYLRQTLPARRRGPVLLALRRASAEERARIRDGVQTLRRLLETGAVEPGAHRADPEPPGSVGAPSRSMTGSSEPTDPYIAPDERGWTADGTAAARTRPGGDVKKRTPAP